MMIEDKDNLDKPLQSEVDPEETDLAFYLETIERLGKERDENYDLLLRKQAEFENYRKRVEKEKSSLRVAAQAAVLEKLLPVLDAFEKGLGELKEEGGSSELQTYRQGFELMMQELQSVLEKFGVEEILGLGTPFDPNVHEAVVTEVTEGYEEGEILEEYRKGYTIQGRLLRPSQVKVAVGSKQQPVDREGED